MNNYPRETVEFQPVTVTVNGAAVTTGVTFADVPSGTRPATFTTPTTLTGRIGVMVQGYPVGVRDIWAKVTANPETPIIYCGSYAVT